LRVLRLGTSKELSSSSRFGAWLWVVELECCDMVDMECGSDGRVSWGSMGGGGLGGGAWLSLRAAFLVLSFASLLLAWSSP
jgi:hypothetical protein